VSVNPETPNERYRIAALAKGLQVLRSLADADRTLTLSELARTTDIPTATLFRIVTTLEQDGYLERDEASGYRPAVTLLRLGFASLRASGLVGAATKAVKDLSASTGETANLGVLQGDRVLYLIRIRNTDLVTAHLEVGSTLPAASTSIGKALLASLTPDQLRRTIDQESFTGASGPNAVRSLDELERRLAVVRRCGISIQDEEVASGLRSIAAPVYDTDHRVVAGVNIAVSASRHSVADLKSKLSGPLLEASRNISMLLGAKPADLNSS
jgi:IclR family pca regulon transcriptional regulator